MNDLILNQIENSIYSNLIAKNEKALSGERKAGSMDSIDTFASCFTHPFNSLADLDEDQFRQDTRKSKDDLKETKSIIRGQNRIGDLRSPASQLNEKAKADKKSAEERAKKCERELPLIVDISKNNRGGELKER